MLNKKLHQRIDPLVFLFLLAFIGLIIGVTTQIIA